MLQGLIADEGTGIAEFANALDAFVQQLPIRPVLLGSVYDPTLGDDRRTFAGVEPKLARANLERMNSVIADIADPPLAAAWNDRYGQLVDLHTHFLQSDPSWFTATTAFGTARDVIEPSLQGASEVRRAFLPQVMQWAQR